MMDAVIRSVGWFVRPVRLPDGEDARGVLQRDGVAALDSYLDAADAIVVLFATIRLAPTLRRFHEIAGSVQ